MSASLNVQTITSQTSGTLIVGSDDPATLIINLDDKNTVYLHNGTAFASTDAQGIFPLAPGMALVVDPSQADGQVSIYAVTASGQTVDVGLVPGGIHFFQPFSRITIPSGATVGQRIVIDGTTGTITMYDASNIVTGQWSATGQFLSIGTATKYVKLVETGTQAEILFNPNSATCKDGSISTSIPGGTQAGLDLLSPDILSNGGPQASLSLVSGDGVMNPVVVSGSAIGSSGTSIQSNNFLYASANQFVSAAGNVALGAAPSGDITICSITFVAEPNRAYKISACFDGITTGGTQTNNHYIFRIKRGASIIMSTRQSATNINQNDCGGAIIAPPDIPIAGGNPPAFVTYSLTANHDVGTDASTLITPAFIMAEGFF